MKNGNMMNGKMIRGRKMQSISSPKMQSNYFVFPGRYGNQTYIMIKSHSAPGPNALGGMRFY